MKKKSSFSKLLIIYPLIIAVIVTCLFATAVAIPFTILPYMGPQILSFELISSIFLLGLLIIGSIYAYAIKSLRRTTRAMQKVAEGDFSVRLPIRKHDPLNESYINFNLMVEELDSTQTLKDDFISQFSHEFKTPITSINGFAKLIESESIPEEKKKEYVSIIAAESERLGKLSEQIMMLTNLENKKIISKQKSVNLDEELRKSIISLLPALEKKQLTYQLDLQKVKYNTDPELLKEVWLNLLNNSIKFTPKTGTIFVSCQEQNGEIEVIIGNNGPKIAENEKNKILEKFYQGETANKSEGLGLGLAIVKQILNLINGRIEILSNYENISGAFFKVILPKEQSIAVES